MTVADRSKPKMDMAKLAESGRRAESSIADASEQVRQLREALETYAEVVRQLTDENQRLRSLVSTLREGEIDSDDSRWFGTHLREAWHALRGR